MYCKFLYELCYATAVFRKKENSKKCAFMADQKYCPSFQKNWTKNKLCIFILKQI